jgi:hypothetical protein
MASELGLVGVQIQSIISLFFQTKSKEACIELQFLPYNHANLNSHSGRSRQIRILGNLSDFSKDV